MWSIFPLFLFRLITIKANNNLGDEAKLINYLLTDYNTAARPVKYANESVQLQIHFTLRNIVELDLKNEILSLNVWAFCFWRDEALVWDPKDYNGLEVVHISSDRIWLPQIVLTNGIRDKQVQEMRMNVVVQNDGSILWIPPWYLRCLCNVDVRFYPFDEQECKLTFVPWSHSSKTVNMSLKFDKIDTKQYSATSFDLLFAEQKQNNFISHDMVYSRVSITLKFRRRVLYHTYTIIWPFVMISILNLLIFRITPESGEKISLGITVLLAFLVLLSIISERMPESSKSVPVIALYMCFVMAMTNISITLSVIILSLHNSVGSDTAVPRWLRWFVVKKLNCILCVKVPKVKPNSVRRQTLKNNISTLVHAVLDVPMLNSNDSLALKENCNDRFAALEESFKKVSIRAQCKRSVLSGTASPAIVPVVVEENDKVKIMKEILDTLRAMLYKQELGDEASNVTQEWRAVAMILDRLFFYIFCLVTIVVTFGLLFLVPAAPRLISND